MKRAKGGNAKRSGPLKSRTDERPGLPRRTNSTARHVICQVSLYPIKGVLGLLGASHSYLEITAPNGVLLDTVEGLPVTLSTGGPKMLVGAVDPEGTGTSQNNPGTDDPFVGKWAISCSEADTVVADALAFQPVPYTGSAGLFGVNMPAGANSNTFMHWLLNATGLSFYYPVPPPGAYGWYNSIPVN